MKLWTIWGSYAATGEGVTFAVMVTYAEGAEDAAKKFTERSKFLLPDGTAEGVHAPALEDVLTGRFMQGMRDMEGHAQVEFYAEQHVNLS